MGADGAAPSVLLVHDITGAEPDIERNLRIVAEAGYLAMAPLMFTAGRNRLGCIVSTMRSLATGTGPAFAVLERARGVLASDARSTGEVAITGFCMGGGFALLEGDARYVAAAPFYGSLTTYRAVTAETCPVVGSFGARDPFIPFGERRLRRVLDRHGIPSDLKTYPGVGHSFANRIEIAPDAVLRVTGLAYDADASADAWSRVFAFFEARFAEAARS
ncbi:dienelactone hydrolase family protein [Tsukamurella sp. PLM1]|uniref:dienelactone hydrolase family protein n=1 Tax=Tsukamurella sp. PLM1 TaxID=2929795 RepID=UPI00204B3F1A|nr:dienelactone hydrolase family protein [Tsukamurella sp. PLM1]BDH55105.1 carboxymethylenebutenolidase [Tsukamurella sp. PLM1]